MDILLFGKWSPHFLSVSKHILQSIQAMDEEKNKLDAFCEQSLKNVSYTLVLFVYDYFLLNFFNVMALMRQQFE